MTDDPSAAMVTHQLDPDWARGPRNLWKKLTDVLVLEKGLFLEGFVCTTDSQSSVLYGSHQQKGNKRHV